MDAVTLSPARPSTRPAGDVESLARLAQSDMAAVDALILDRMQSQVPVIPLLAEHIVSAGGKNVYPAPIEERLAAHPLVDQVMVVGEGRESLAALVVP